MKTFVFVAAQGDIMIERIKDGRLPSNVKRVPPKGKRVIVTHSETGHHHVMSALKTEQYMTSNQMISLLKVKETDQLVHLRDHDTHETLEVKPGLYRVRRQREHVVGSEPKRRLTRDVRD